MAAFDQAYVDAILADWRTASIDGRLQAAFAFLEQLAPLDGEPTVEHVEQLKLAGVSKQGIEDIIYICYRFNVFTRLADAFDFDPVPPKTMAQDAKMMLRFGYGLISL